MLHDFPQYSDVPLKKAPLGEVICQVRFSPLFRIASDLPSDLQEAIFERFPEAQFADDADPHLYQFSSHDTNWTLRIGPEAFTLSTNRYTVWEEFSSFLAAVQNAMQRTYRISSYRRIGLRYINVFMPANTGGRSLAEISEVLRPELVAPLRAQELADTSGLATHILFEESDGTLALRIGAQPFAREEGPVLFLDLDFSVEGFLPTNDLIERCTAYHDTIYRVFRWSVNPDKLHLFDPVTEGVGQ